MNQYHKIQTVFKRDPETKYKTLLMGEYAKPEFEYLKDCPWIMTEKVDGTNIRIMWDDERTLTIGGKTDNAQLHPELIGNLTTLFPPSILDGYLEPGTCLYGEGYGPGIQKGGGRYRDDKSFVLFDVKVGDWWLRRDQVQEVAINLGVGIVPIMAVGPLSMMVGMCRDELYSRFGTVPFQAEGLVATPKVPLHNRAGERIITKLKCKDCKGASQCRRQCGHICGLGAAVSGRLL